MSRGIADYRFALKQAIAERDGMFCNICRRAICVLDSDINIDHVVPLSKGGKTEFNNLAITHVKCNTGKGNG